jgi:diacylglycerol kinase (ATP)
MEKKNLPFSRRIRFALSGLRAAFRSESSFRTQVTCASGALALLLLLRPKPVWWALVFLVVAAVLAAELLNTALEAALDRLHPEQHPLIGRAKDCAAAAVLVLSLASLVIAAALLVDFLKP